MICIDNLFINNILLLTTFLYVVSNIDNIYIANLFINSPNSFFLKMKHILSILISWIFGYCFLLLIIISIMLSL